MLCGRAFSIFSPGEAGRAGPQRESRLLCDGISVCPHPGKAFAGPFYRKHGPRPGTGLVPSALGKEFAFHGRWAVSVKHTVTGTREHHSEGQTNPQCQ